MPRLCMAMLIIAFVFCAAPLIAQSTTAPLAGKKIVIDPAEGTLKVAGNPMPTIGVATPSVNPSDYNTDINHYYESVVNLDIAKRLKAKLVAAGATDANVILTRTGIADNPTSEARLKTVTDAAPDFFVSVQANAHFDGSTNNYLYLAYRGDDEAIRGKDPDALQALEAQYTVAKKSWRYLFEAMGEGFEPFTGGYTYDDMKVGYQNLSIMEHTIPGFVDYGYFRTYQPARQRALSSGWRDQEATRLFRAIAANLAAHKQTTGDIMGVVKSSDERMTNSDVLSPTSFAYIEGSHDQYKPLNGATVTLYKDQETTAFKTYTVDNNYNGIFVFTDLAPGTYQVEATIGGYYTQKQNVEVTANETVYPTFLLSKQIQGLTVLSTIEDIAQRWDNTFAIEGDVRRVVQMGENIVILSHETTTRKPHLYAINHRTQAFSELSTKVNGTELAGYDSNNPRAYLSLSDIAVTDDGVLVGCNFVTTYYGDDDGYVEDGGQRNPLNFYKWETITSNPTLWVSKTTGGINARDNYHCVGLSRGADMGYTMAVSGTADNCVLTITGVDHDYTLLRYAHITVVNNDIASGTYTKSGLANPTSFLDIMGKGGTAQDYRLGSSPLGAERWVIDGTTTTANEFIQTTSGSYNTINGSIPSTIFGTKPIATSHVKYKDNILAVAPHFNESTGQVLGLRVANLSGQNFSQAALVTTNTTLQTAIANSKHASATAYADGNNLYLFLIVDNRIIKFSNITADQEATQTADRNIFAYDLRVTDVNKDHTTYNFTFETNEIPIDGAATLILYKDGAEVHRKTVNNLVEARHTKYTISLNATEMETLRAKGLNTGDVLTWGIEVEAHRVLNWAKDGNNLKPTYSVVKAGNTTFTHTFHAIDNFPESPQFGRIYILEAVSTKATSNTNGIYIVEPQYTLTIKNGTDPYKGGQNLCRPGRPSIDSEGYLYIPSFYDDEPGIFVATPSNTSGTWTQLLAGTKDNTGRLVYTNGTEQIYTGSNFPAIAMYGKGANTKLVTLNEDVKTVNSKKLLEPDGLQIYNLGQQHGNILHTWQKAPSTLMDIGCYNISVFEPALQAIDQGIFISISKHSAADTDPSPRDYSGLIFYNWEGEERYVLKDNTFDPTSDLSPILGCGFVVSSNGKILIVDNKKPDATNHDFLIYDISWRGDVPTLTLRERIPHNLGAIYQMNFDYAGNLLVSGANGLHIFGTPSLTANKRITPAASSRIVIMPEENVANIVSEATTITITDLSATPSKDDLSEYVFKFTTNVNARAASLLFYGSDGTTILTEIPLSNLPTANVEQTCTIAAAQISTLHNNVMEELKWGVKITSQLSPYWIATPTTNTTKTGGKMYHVVDTNPASPYYGNIYVMHNVGTGNTSNGVYIYKYNSNTNALTTNGTLYKGGTHQLNDPRRLSIDEFGHVYMADFSDTHAGVFMFDPANLTSSSSFIPVYQTTYPTTGGLVKNGSTIVGAATTTVAFYPAVGTEPAKMLTYAKTGGGDFVGQDVLVYNVGNITNWGTTNWKWTTTPTSHFKKLGTSSTATGHIVPVKNGFWAMQYRANGSNTGDYPVLKLYDWNGELLFYTTDYNNFTAGDNFASGSGKDEEIPGVWGGNTTDGKDGLAFAVSEKDNKLVIELNDKVNDKYIHTWKVYDIIDNKLVYNYKFDAGITKNTHQISFDDQGNIIATGEYGVKVYKKNIATKTATSTFKHVIITEPTKQPVRGIFAYDLRVNGKVAPETGKTYIEPDVATNAYEFTFMANETATQAEIIFYSDATRTTELSRKTIPAVTAGSNSITILARDLPENNGNAVAWSIALTGEPITQWGTLSRDRQTLGSVPLGAGGVSAINNNPQSDKFGRIYAYYKAGTNAQDNPITGSYIYTPLEDRLTNPPQANSPITGANLARMSTDDAGNLYLTSKSDENPGIFIGIPSAEDRDKMTFRRFFHNNATIDQSSAGFPIIKYGNTEIGSALLGVDVMDMGGTIGTVLMVYANGHYYNTASTDPPEVVAGKIPYHSILFYELGTNWDPTTITESATSYGHTKAPDKIVDFRRSNKHAANTADVWGTSHGFFACHARSLADDYLTKGSNNNNLFAASLLFVTSNTINANSADLVSIGSSAWDSDGREFDFNSGWPEYQFYINGSEGGAMAMTADEKTLIMLNASSQFLVFDVAWTDHKPTLTLRAVYNTGIGSINQMDFDYGGNLVTTGIEGMATFTIPDPNKPINRTETPAINELLVKHNAPTHDRIFEGTVDKLWSKAANWKDNLLPGIGTSVLIEKPCEVDIQTAAAQFIDLQKGTIGNTTYNATLTVLATGSLTVAKDIRKVSGTNYTTRSATTTSDLIVRAGLNADGKTLEQGILAQFDTEGTTQATVQLCGKYDQSTGIWQHVGVPFTLPTKQAREVFYGSFIHKWDEPTSAFIQLTGFEEGIELTAYQGYMLGQKTNKAYTMAGTLLPATYTTINLSATESQKTDTYNNYGANFLANPYTAPLRIDKIDVSEHLKNVEATIYIYDPSINGGMPTWSTDKGLSGYTTYPIGAASFMEDPVINPMQGFWVMATSAGASIELHPKQLIAGGNEKDYEGQPGINKYHAPRRKVIIGPDDEDEIPVTDMHIRVESDDNLHCDLLMLESEAYTHGFDNGWDGRKWADDYGIPYLAAASNEGDMAVLATPELDGTFLTFYPGTGTSYTLTFTYEGNENYLLEDSYAEAAAIIRTGNTYTFTPSDDDTYRFRIVRQQKQPDMTTTAPTVWANGDKLYLTNPSGLLTEISIYSADGKLIRTLTTHDTVAQLHVPSSGVYMIRLRSEQGVQTIKHIL